MNQPTKITTLFLDIGGVLLSDGWTLDMRGQAAQTFDLDPVQLESLHHQVFATYELGKISLDEYLERAVFHCPRSFTAAQFTAFMFAQSRPYPEMLALIRQVKAKYGLKVFVISNEGRELNEHRIQAFQLAGLVDIFVSSCYVHMRKPDPEIFRLALDMAQTPVEQIVYLENTPMFTRIAQELGIASILHADEPSTRAQLASYGLA